MTLEELIRIVAETVEQVMALSRKKVRIICWNTDHKEELMALATAINGSAEPIPFTSLENAALPDALFLDYIPVEYLAELALGFANAPFTKFVNRAVLNGSQVFVLKETPLPKNAPQGCRNLLNCYRKMLLSYGYIFIENQTIAGTSVKPVSSEISQTYSGNVLSRADLLEYAQNGVLTVTPSVIITDLAAETAKKMNININIQA